MRGRDIFLLILIVVAGVLLTQTDRGNINWSWGWDDWDGGFFGLSHEATAQESREIEAPLPQELVVRNDHGDVVVLPSPDGRMTVVLDKTAYRRTEEEAKQDVADLHLVVSREGSRLVLSTNRSEFRRGRFRSSFKIMAPEGLPVDVESSYGLVRTLKTGRTTVVNRHGPVSATGVAGDCSAQTSYDDINVSDVAGLCDLDARHGSVTVLRVKGAAKVGSSYAEVRLEDVGGDVTVDAIHTQITGRRLAGAVRVETSYRDISLADIGAATIVGHHSGIDVTDAKAGVNITDNYGRVGLERVQGTVVVNGHNVEVTGKTVNGPGITISTSYDGINLTDFSGAVDITGAHSSIHLSPSRLEADLKVETTYGEISLDWPSGTRNPFEGRTRYGRVRWNVSDKPDIDETDGQSLVKAFSAVSGRPRVSLATSYADITVNPIR